MCLVRKQNKLLQKCAATALSSKLVAHEKEFFGHMVVDAVRLLDELLPLDMIGMKKVQGGALEVRHFLVDGSRTDSNFRFWLGASW